MSITTFATKAAYEAASKPTDNARIAAITEDKDVMIDGVNTQTDNPNIGDALYLDADNNKIWIAGNSVVPSAIPSGWTAVGVCFGRKEGKALVINKSGSGIKYADVVQFKVTIPSATGTLTMGAQFVEAGTTTSISVEYTAGMTLATEANTYETESTTLCGLINTALEALSGITGDWWAYMNDDGDVILQRDTWTDYRQYICSGSLTHVTWGDMPESSVYFKNDGGYTNYWGVMNVARTRAWATSNGRVPTSEEPIMVTGNPAPVKPVCFEDSNAEGYAYTGTIREYYGTYDNYLREGYGVKYPQDYGAFAIGTGKELCAKYALESAPTKDGSTKYKYPAMYACYTVTYGDDDLTIGNWWLPGVEEGCELMLDETVAKIGPTLSKMGGSVVNNSTYRWFAQRNNVYYASLFYGHVGNLHSNGVYGGGQVQAVTLLDI